MAGTREGGLKAVETTKRKHGADFLAEAGRKGGKISRGGGFAYMKRNNPEKLKEVSIRGGKGKKLASHKA